MTAADPNGLSRELLAERLDSVFAARPLEGSGGRHAAVALVVGARHGVLGFLLTQRARRLTSHSGQFALPGGRVEAGESVYDAALRELREELDLALTRADAVGRLPDYRTASGYRIAPVVVWAGALRELRPNPDEVARAYHIPLAALRAPSVPTLIWSDDPARPIIQLPLGGDRVIHAPTGAILYQFAEAALAGRYVDARAFAEPVWARR